MPSDPDERTRGNPLDADTDGDSLPDAQEWNSTWTVNLLNGDGTPFRDYEVKSCVHTANCDSDDWDDDVELAQGTDPRNPNTDGDETFDSRENPAGYSGTRDPLRPDKRVTFVVGSSASVVGDCDCDGAGGSTGIDITEPSRLDWSLNGGTSETLFDIKARCNNEPDGHACTASTASRTVILYDGGSTFFTISQVGLLVEDDDGACTDYNDDEMDSITAGGTAQSGTLLSLTYDYGDVPTSALTVGWSDPEVENCLLQVTISFTVN